MNALQGFTVCAAVVFCCLLEMAQAECTGQSDVNAACNNNVTVSTTTTSISAQACDLSIQGGNQSSNITGLQPGGVYFVHAHCSNCCLQATTKPEGVIRLTITDITTSSLSLNWMKPEGNVSSYKVNWSGGGQSDKSDKTLERALNISELTPGGQYHVTVTAVAGDDLTEGEGHASSTYTKPEKILNLTVTEVTTSDVTLSWTKPKGLSSFYAVHWTDGNNSMTHHVTDTDTVISKLTAGVEYTITVTAVAGDDQTAGKNVTVTKYTRPAKPVHVTVNQRMTDSLNISWTLPEGRVDHYEVQLEGEINKTNRSWFRFTNLSPGRLFEVNVTAVAGDFRNTSKSTKFATYPLPPESIQITGRTNDSLHLSWSIYPKMEDAPNISYNITYRGDVPGQMASTVNNATLSDLVPGSLYDITVETVGPEDLLSSEAKTSACTNPNPVLSLKASPESNTSVKVEWSQTQDYKLNYSYSIVTYNATGNVVSNQTIPGNIVSVTGLDPGTEYTIAVTTQVTPECQSTEEEVSSYTKPNAVSNLLVQFVNTTAITLSWDNPTVYDPPPTYLVQAFQGLDKVYNVSTNQLSHTIPGLTPGETYTFTVIVEVANVRSSEETVTNTMRPAKPVHVTVNQRMTDSLNISWTLPEGRVDHYEVQLEGEINKTNRSWFRFTNLSPGRLFEVNVTAVAGDFRNTSKSTKFATYPLPPESIQITGRTNDSLHLSWSIYPKMEDAPNISYNITYRGDVPGQMASTVNNATLSDLVPGSLYDITVETVGPEDLLSSEAKTSACTNPNPVLSLKASPESNTSVKVEWSQPQDYKLNYSYSIVTYNATGNVVSNQTIPGNIVSVTGLDPGTEYTIAVTTQVTPECQSTEEEVSSYTKPNAVSNLLVQFVNTTAITLSWDNPTVYDPPPTYLVQAFQGLDKVYNVSTNQLSHTIPGLTPGETYTFTVIVEVANVRSSEETVTNTMRPEAVTITEISGSTNILTVSWSAAQGRVDNYTVFLYNQTDQVQDETVANDSLSTSFTGLKPGVEYCAEVVTRRGPLENNYSKSCNATFPNPPGNINVNQTERSILFTWGLPEDMQPDTYGFKVTISNKTNDINNPYFKLEGCQPGSPYTISVATVGVYNYTSKEVVKEAFTRPEAVTITEITGSTNDLTVSWSAAQGRVDNYTVILYLKNDQVQNETVPDDSLNTSFTGLKPGVEYCAEVVTRSGPLANTSPQSCNATFPNPPGSINVTIQTVQSLTFAWGAPEDMQSDQYDFDVTFYNGTTVTQKNTTVTLKDLESGSPYNISVVTVGANNLVSQEVVAVAYTRPYPVTELQQTEITPDSVTLRWNQTEHKPDYTYLVEVSNISGPPLPLMNTSTLTYTVKGLMSGTNYSFSVTAQTADGTAAAPNTVHYFTRPYSIEALAANPLNTTSINLTWGQPRQYKPQYKYLVQTSACRETTNQTNKTTLSESIVISGLIPGTECRFCVTVMAESGIEGESNCTSQYTKPEKPEPHVSNRGSNSSMHVLWAKPEGNVEFYKVYLYNGSDVNMRTSPKLNSSGQYSFNNLSPGRNYTVIVEAQSGPFKASSEPITNATFPNPPGAISIVNQTTDSLWIQWEEAPKMSGAQFYYRLEISAEVHQTKKTNYTFGQLRSGTVYNISVTTVAAMKLESKSVWYYRVTTRPFPVQNLQAVPSERSVTLNWSKPREYKDSYRFIVELLGFNGSIEKNPMSTITDLDSGTPYNFTVTTETSDGTQGAPKIISACTDASPVEFHECNAPDGPYANLTWNWIHTEGLFSNFSVQFGETIITKNCDDYCTFKKADLDHYRKYTVTVTTQSCGNPSSSISKTCRTGITAPPVSKNYISMLEVDDITFNAFTIIIEPSLLNNTNGPIKHVGVLVTKAANDPVVSDSNVAEYLENDYHQWKAGESDVYLATGIDIDPSGNGERSSTKEPLRIRVGNGEPWRGYLNGNLEPTEKYKYAIVLFTDLQIWSEVIDASGSLFTCTGFVSIQPLPQNPVVIGMAVGVTMGIFCVLLIVLVGFIIYWRRLASKESSDVQIQSLSAKVSVPVRVEDFEVYYKKQKADSNCGFAEEYEDLKVTGTGQSKIHALNPENKPKNRYSNVVPYDASRVKLSIIHGNPLDDYINANYIPGYISRKEFIAAQGPLRATVNDFWRMIWEKNVHTIVMLTRCNEQGRVKCEQYWAPGTSSYGNITVTTTSEIPLDDWTIRDFDVKNVKTAETRPVRHFHFTAWPDHGVPETTELLISFRHLVRENMDQYKHSPTVVHCSAGVGRTGTFIAIDRLIFQIERENVVDVYGIVYDMRLHRVLMVQTEDQYVFLNQCALDIIRSRTGNNVDLIYQNMAALSIYEHIELQKK